MGFPFKKKKKEALVETSGRRRKFLGVRSNRKKGYEETPQTVEPTPDLLDTLRVGSGNEEGAFEIVTPETRDAFSPTENVRRNLFQEEEEKMPVSRSMPSANAAVRIEVEYDPETPPALPRFASAPHYVSTIPEDVDDTQPFDESPDKTPAGKEPPAKLASVDDNEETPKKSNLSEIIEDGDDDEENTMEDSNTLEDTGTTSLDMTKTDTLNSTMVSTLGSTYDSRMQNRFKKETVLDIALEACREPSEREMQDESQPPQQVGGSQQGASGPARRLLGAFNCGTENDADSVPTKPVNASVMFYDVFCSDVEKRDSKRRPYFNEDFTTTFLHEMMTRGISLLYLQAPGTFDNDTLDWRGRSVTMSIEPGDAGDGQAVQPRLHWSTMPGGKETKPQSHSVSLLGMHSISTSVDEMRDDEDDENEMCFFAVTTKNGDVHVFETASVRQRDWVFKGLKNVVARLSFLLIAGDVKVSSELYSNLKPKESAPGELPSLPNPQQNMNRIAHALLD